jgi:tRNA dimethylallyltransferase
MRAFFIVGPTAIGKSEIAAEVACVCGAEIVSADAFQIYRGLDLLTAKPDPATRANAPHHLIGEIALTQEMNAEKFRVLAKTAIRDINTRGKLAMVVSGSGLYVRALTHGLAILPAANSELRDELNQSSVDELHARLAAIDPETAGAIDSKNPRRLIRALEICLLTGKPVSAQRSQIVAAVADRGPRLTSAATGVFVFRERADLYDRINRRVEAIFASGVIDEVRALGKVGATAEQTLGLREIRQLIAGEISEPECIAAIQQGTRRYAKRQLTWFRRQTNFPALNLSLYGHSEAIEWISRETRLSLAHRDD